MRPFETYQLEELQYAREYLDKAWKCRNAHAVQRTVSSGDVEVPLYGYDEDWE